MCHKNSLLNVGNNDVIESGNIQPQLSGFQRENSVPWDPERGPSLSIQINATTNTKFTKYCQDTRK